MTQSEKQPPSTTKVKFTAKTDTGQIREKNEDSYSAHPDIGLFIVADGMGGHAGGEIASEIAVNFLPEKIKQLFKKTDPNNHKKFDQSLDEIIYQLNEHTITQATQHSGFEGMGTTVVLAIIRNNSACILNVGDSRCFLFRNKKLTQITIDHTVLAEMQRSGIKPSPAEKWFAGAQLTHYIGIDKYASSAISHIQLQPSDRLLMCTDGLTDTVENNQISQILAENPNPEIACKKLIFAANLAGGHDNITTLIIDYTP